MVIVDIIGATKKKLRVVFNAYPLYVPNPIDPSTSSGCPPWKIKDLRGTW